MEIIIAAVLAIMAVNHTDETPVPNFYQQGGYMVIAGEPANLKPLGWGPDGIDMQPRYNPNEQHFLKK